MNNKAPVCQGIDGPCENRGSLRRQNTAYVDDEKNWVILCDEHNKHNEAHWKSMWNEYWGSRL